MDDNRLWRDDMRGNPLAAATSAARKRGVMAGGFILKSVQYSVWCADCDNLIDYAEYRNRKEAEREFRKQGWRKTKRGWVCPKHKPNLNNSRAVQPARGAQGGDGEG